MVNNPKVHIIMPVKDSLATAEEAVRAVVASGYSMTVYDDFSSPETAAGLDRLHDKTGIRVVHLRDRTGHLSPNYRFVLIDAQKECIAEGCHLVIIESDVIIRPDTIGRMVHAVQTDTGMIAAVTTDAQGLVNFPYEYARRIHTDGPCKKRLSFCCTLLTNTFLRAYDFGQLDPDKNWYDVHISHMSAKLQFKNILQVSNPVLHKPHSSRPWKQLKYTRPVLYYWRKLTRRLDKI